MALIVCPVLQRYLYCTDEKLAILRAQRKLVAMTAINGYAMTHFLQIRKERGNKQSQQVVGPSTVTVSLRVDAAEAVKLRLEEFI